MFELMHRACKEIDGLHLIVLDHAHRSDEWFEASIVEEWRRDRFLMPPTWETRSGWRCAIYGFQAIAFNLQQFGIDPH